jgi:hypothetical protein
MKLGGRWGFVDKNSKLVTSPQFNEAFPFANGVTRVKVARKVGDVDPSGKYFWNPIN